MRFTFAEQGKSVDIINSCKSQFCLHRMTLLRNFVSRVQSGISCSEVQAFIVASTIGFKCPPSLSFNDKTGFHREIICAIPVRYINTPANSVNKGLYIFDLWLVKIWFCIEHLNGNGINLIEVLWNMKMFQLSLMPIKH